MAKVFTFLQIKFRKDGTISPQQLCATHIQINKTNRSNLKTKGILPKNSMNPLIKEALSITIMIPEQGWDISSGWDPYSCYGCHCCSQTHARTVKITPGSGLCHVLHAIQTCSMGIHHSCESCRAGLLLWSSPKLTLSDLISFSLWVEDRCVQVNFAVQVL